MHFHESFIIGYEKSTIVFHNIHLTLFSEHDQQEDEHQAS